MEREFTMLKSATDIWELGLAALLGVFSWGLAWGQIVKKSAIYDKHGNQIYLSVVQYEKSIAKIEEHCEKTDTTLIAVRELMVRLDERYPKKNN